jgi:hypothetical protein
MMLKRDRRDTRQWLSDREKVRAALASVGATRLVEICTQEQADAFRAALAAEDNQNMDDSAETRLADMLGRDPSPADVEMAQGLNLL